MKKLMIYNFILRIIGMGLSFVYVPKVLDYLGVFNYGIWATILAILSWINFCDIGIGNSLRTNLVEYIENKDKKMAKKLVSTAYINITIISIFLFVMLFIFLKVFNTTKLLNVEYKYLNKLLLISFSFVIINFILSLCKPIYYALQKPYIVSLIEISIQIINIFGVLYFLYLKKENSLICIAILYGGASLFANTLYTLFLFKKNKYLTPSIKYYDKKLNLIIGNLGLKFFILQIVVVILFTTDSVIITKLFGPEEVTPYNIANKIYGVFISMYGILLTPLWSKISQEKSRKNYVWIEKTLHNLKLFFIIIILGMGVFYVIYPYITKIWLGRDIVYPNYLLINILLYVLLSIWCNNYSYIMNGMGKVDLQVKIAIIQGIINIPISIYLGHKIGVAGIVLGTNICMAIPAVLFPLKFKIIEEKE